MGNNSDGVSFICMSNGNSSGGSGSDGDMTVVPEGFSFYGQNPSNSRPKLLMYITGVSGNVGIRGNLVLGKEQKHNSGSYKLDVSGSGNFSGDLDVGGTIIGDVSGNAASATKLETAINIGGVSFNGTSDITPSKIYVAEETASNTRYLLFAGTGTGGTNVTGNKLVRTNSNISVNPSTGTLTASNFSGNGSGLTSLSAANITGTLTTDKIQDGSITTAKIANNNVTTAKIANSNVTNAKIADGAVTNAKIDDGAVTTAKIAYSNVTNAKIDDGAVTTAKISDGAVTNAKLQNSSITLAGQNVILGGSITEGNMKTNLNLNTSDSVQFTKLGLGKVPSTELDVDGSGNFTGNLNVAGTIIGDVSGTATKLKTAITIGNVTFDGTQNITPKNIQITTDSGDATHYLLFADSVNGSNRPKTNSNITVNPSTGTLTANEFSGNGSGLTSLSAANITGTLNKAGLNASYLDLQDNESSDFFTGTPILK